MLSQHTASELQEEESLHCHGMSPTVSCAEHLVPGQTEVLWKQELLGNGLTGRSSWGLVLQSLLSLPLLVSVSMLCILPQSKELCPLHTPCHDTSMLRPATLA